MATRCELSREDNVRWVRGTSGNIYRDTGRNNRSLPIPVGLDLRYSADLSDQDDRRTSSCSPESCELPHDCTIPYKASDAFSLSSFKQNSYANYVDNCSLHRSPVQMPVQEWSLTHSNHLLHSSISAPLLQDLQSSNSKHIRHKTKSCDEDVFAFGRKHAAPEAFHSSRLDRPLSVSSNRMPVFAGRDENKQNGACVDKPDACPNHCGKPIEVFESSMSRTSPITNFRNRLISSNEVTKKQSKSRDTPTTLLIQANLSKQAKSEKFGESDAAEALLVLSEGFYQTNVSPKSDRMSPTSEAVHSDNKVCASTQNRHDEGRVQSNSSCHTKCVEFFPVHTSQSNSDLGNGQANKSGTQQCNDASSSNCESTHGHKHSKFHFKKFICQKFVNSLDREKDQTSPHNDSLIPASTAASPECKQQENGFRTTKVSTDVDDPNDNKTPLQPATAPVESSISVKDTTSPPPALDADVEVSNTIKPNSVKPNDVTGKTDEQNFAFGNSKKQRLKETLTQVPKLYKPVNKRRKKSTSPDPKCKPPVDTEVQSKLQNKIKLTENPGPFVANPHNTAKKSNLYRVSTSLGSSSESLCASEDNMNDPTASDSSTDSSESETDESDQLNSDDEAKKMNWASAPKRKGFVMNSAKFSLPSKEQNKIALPESRYQTAKNNNRLSETSNMSYMKTDRSTGNVGNGSFSSLKKFDLRNTEPVKQSGIHIKKAVFTFSSLSKQDKTSPRESGLKMTSQSNALVDQTLCVKKDKTSVKFDKEKLDPNEPEKRKQDNQENETIQTITFGKFHDGNSFERLSKPDNEDSKSNTRKKTSLGNSNESPTTESKHSPLTYDKHRLPRPSARSAALEAQQLIKRKAGRKRKVSAHRENVKSSQKVKMLKRSKSAIETGKKLSPTPAPQSATCVSADLKDKTEQNGDTLVDTNISSGTLGLSRSSSRRKPARVYKHQKYTSVSMMSSTYSPRDLATSTEFAIMRKPLSLDHRMLLAHSFDLDRSSNDNSDSCHSLSMTSSPCSSRTSSLAGDDNDGDVNKKDDVLSPDKSKHRLKRYRHCSAVESTVKSDFLKRKQKLKRLLSVSGQSSHGQAARLVRTNMLQNTTWRSSRSTYGSSSSFSLLSHFPAPASLRPGHALGELLPGYGPSVSGQRSTLPLRWKKGGDITDLKQKRQRAKWRSLTLDMFCMGAKSKRNLTTM